MGDLLATVKQICETEIGVELTESSNLYEDVDSLDLLDIIFVVDRQFGIKIPMETWVFEIHAGACESEKYFRLDNFSREIGKIIAAKEV